MKNRLALLSVLLLGSLTLLAAEPPPKPGHNAAFDKLKVLVGSWQGTYEEGGTKMATNARFRLVSDNSALAAWLNEDSDHEMVTMIHPDGADLIATHYCSAHNQPRMVLVPGSDPNRLTFKFRDGTNIAPGDGHMQQVAFIFDGPDHHIQEWTFLENGKESPPARFDFRRKPRLDEALFILSSGYNAPLPPFSTHPLTQAIEPQVRKPFEVTVQRNQRHPIFNGVRCDPEIGVRHVTSCPAYFGPQACVDRRVSASGTRTS